jgi:hypothetical protein
VAARRRLRGVRAREVEPAAHDPIGHDARHHVALTVADLVEALSAEVTDPRALNGRIVGRRGEFGVALHRVVDAEELRVVVVEVLDAPGPVGADHVFAQHSDEGGNQRDVRDDDAGPDLLARQERVGGEPDSARAAFVCQDLVDGTRRPDFSAVRDETLDQRVGQGVRSTVSRVHGHRHHSAQVQHLRTDPPVERPLPRELAESAGQRADLLGLEEHLEELEARHPADVVAGQRDAQGRQQPVVEGRHAVRQLGAG